MPYVMWAQDGPLPRGLLSCSSRPSLFAFCSSQWQSHWGSSRQLPCSMQLHRRHIVMFATTTKSSCQGVAVSKGPTVGASWMTRAFNVFWNYSLFAIFRARQRSGEGVVRRNGCPKGCFWRVRFFSAPLRFSGPFSCFKSKP